jgi:hypothetical protein
MGTRYGDALRWDTHRFGAQPDGPGRHGVRRVKRLSPVTLPLLASFASYRARGSHLDPVTGQPEAEVLPQ